MFDTFKPFVVVFVLALTVFKLAEPVCLKFVEKKDYIRRRNVWLLLTTLAFLSPNFWIFAVCALILVYWAGSVEENPTALYALLMLCVPPCEFLIPLPLVNQLFGLSPARILILALIVPASFRMVRAGAGWPHLAAKADVMLLAFGLLQLLLYAEFESPTNTLRRAFLFLLDSYAIYFFFSRGIADKRKLIETLISFCLSCMVQVPITVFETVKGWLLYTGIPERWGAPNFFSWLMRGDALRAQGPAGHSLTMGFTFAIGFGAWMFVGPRIASNRLFLFVMAAFWAGLISTYARGPWVVAAFIFVASTLLSPGGSKRIGKVLLSAVVVLGVLSFTPFGAKIFALLPFVGNDDQGNIDYRQQLATVSWQLIKEHPWLGNPFALDQMEDLRQGQGIIDLVNTYASFALFYGGIGVSLFFYSLLYPMLKTFLAARDRFVRSEDIKAAGASLVSCMLGIMLMLVTVSFISGIDTLSWIFAGLCSSFPLVSAADFASEVKSSRRPVPAAVFS